MAELESFVWNHFTKADKEANASTSGLWNRAFNYMTRLLTLSLKVTSTRIDADSVFCPVFIALLHLYEVTKVSRCLRRITPQVAKLSHFFFKSYLLHLISILEAAVVGCFAMLKRAKASPSRWWGWG